MSDATAVNALFQDVTTHLDGLDVLVNNAGVAGPTAPVDKLDVAAWSSVVNVNLTGTFLVTRAAVPLLKQSAQASIIVADVAALVMFLAGRHARTISGQMFPIDGDAKSAQ